ncbi:MAG: GT4 family glycosyltransferase PelF [Acidobacteria bacterium]|nr:GT4 family glycosyltransferase PelF [Acidobacteriota bacterium]
MTAISVLLTTEGTYPFHKGGVSTWCDVLVRNLPEIDFTVLAVIMHPYLKQRYELPENVRQLLKVPLWGISDPVEYSWHFPFSTALKIKLSTVEQTITKEFLPLFEEILLTIFSSNFDRDYLGSLLVLLHNYFQNRDYHQTMKSRAVWQSFSSLASKSWQKHNKNLPVDNPTISELTEALRLIYHFLLVLHFPIPPSDLTHSAAAGFCGLPCVVAKIERKTPYLLTEHGTYIREQYLNLSKQIQSLFVRWFLYQLIGSVVAVNYHFADQVSPVCSYNIRWEKWWGVSEEKIKVIYNGANPKVFYPIKCPTNSRPTVANVGLIFALKGTLDLIEAAKIVRQTIPDVEFCLYGSASDEKYFAECQKRVKDYNLENTVTFAGPTDKPAQVYSQADVIVMASISEGFPYVVIEAMLCGAAIVSTSVGGVPEALKDVGLLVKPHHPEELAKSITRLLKSPKERQDFGNAACKKALELFTQEKFLNEYRESYQQLASRSNPSTSTYKKLLIKT